MAIRKYTKFAWGGVHQFFINPFTPDLKNKKILDIGCGKGINGYLIRVTRDLQGAQLIGLDINENYLQFCHTHKIYDRLVRARLPKLPFADRSIDLVLCNDVIEHLNKREGKILLKEIERVCKGRTIITTPNSFFHTVENEDPDIHRSLWTVRDFRDAGYKVFGLGLKTAILVNDPFLKIKQALYYLFTPLSYLVPEIGGILFCVRDCPQKQ